MPYTSRPSNTPLPEEFASDGSYARFVKLRGEWPMSLAPQMAAIVDIGTAVTCDVETKAGKRHTRSGTVVRLQVMPDGTPRALCRIEKFRPGAPATSATRSPCCRTAPGACGSTSRRHAAQASATRSRSRSPPNPAASPTSRRGSRTSSRTNTATARRSGVSSSAMTGAPGSRTSRRGTGSLRPVPSAGPRRATPESPDAAPSRRSSTRASSATSRWPTRRARTSTPTSSRSGTRPCGVPARPAVALQFR